MCIPSLITLHFYGMVFKLDLIFFFNGNFGFLSKWPASQAELQAMPSHHPLSSTKQYSQPGFNMFNLF